MNSQKYKLVEDKINVPEPRVQWNGEVQSTPKSCFCRFSVDASFTLHLLQGPLPLNIKRQFWILLFMGPPSLGETEGAEPPCLMLLPFVMSAFGSKHTACNTHICNVFSNYFSYVFNSPRPLPTPLKSIRAPIFSRARILSKVLKICGLKFEMHLPSVPCSFNLSMNDPIENILLSVCLAL